MKINVNFKMNLYKKRVKLLIALMITFLFHARFLTIYL